MPAPKLPVLPPTNREKVLKHVIYLLERAFPGKPVRLKAEVARPDKTNRQNRFLWGIPYAMLEQVTGHEAEDLHEYFCAQKWGWKDKPVPVSAKFPDGIERVPMRTTTTDENGEPDYCSQEDMVDLWNRAQRVGAGLGITIPDPDPYYRTKRAA